MDHEAFREMIRYFARVWRDGAGEVVENEVKIWGWYRTHPAMLTAGTDDIGRPDRSDWVGMALVLQDEADSQANDLLNFMVIVPRGLNQAELVVSNGQTVHRQRLNAGKANAMTVPFVPGSVTLELLSSGRSLMKQKGREIDGKIEKYNFNMWTGTWTIAV